MRKKPKFPGDPNCPHCEGKGVIMVSEEAALRYDDKGEARRKVPGIFTYEECTCVYYKRVIRNVERGWKGLYKAPRLPKDETSPLEDYWRDDLWVTATNETFKAHLRWLALRRPPSWNFDVVSDSDLMVSWLASAALKGVEILDPDAATVSMRRLTVVDLVEPPSLLVIRLGVKAARNQAMSEVFLEALSHRAHIGRPTWVFDQPDQPLDHTHKCWSSGVEGYLSDWPHFSLDKIMIQPTPHPARPNVRLPGSSSPAPTPSRGARPPRRLLSEGSGRAQAVEETLEERVRREAEEKEKAKYRAKRRRSSRKGGKKGGSR